MNTELVKSDGCHFPDSCAQFVLWFFAGVKGD